MKPRYKLHNDGRITPVPLHSTKARCREALADLHRSGISVSQWARDNGYTRNVVASVVYGRSACLGGQAHEVAVALGIKAGYVVKPGTYKPKVPPVNANQGLPS